jgi:hypothetical protein
MSLLRYLVTDAILNEDWDPKVIDIPMQATKAYGSSVTAYSLLPSTLDETEWSASRPGRFA